MEHKIYFVKRTLRSTTISYQGAEMVSNLPTQKGPDADLARALDWIREQDPTARLQVLPAPRGRVVDPDPLIETWQVFAYPPNTPVE